MSSVVALDTATDDTCVGAVRGREILFEARVGAPQGGRPAHAAAALPALEEAAGALGGWEAVERLVAGVGPGSFTGLRIGLATARGLASAAGTELVGVGTLDALAEGVLEGDPEASVLATVDARRGQVFAALFTGGERAWEPFVADPADLAERLRADGSLPVAVGGGAIRFRGELAGVVSGIPDDESDLHRVAARHLCTLGLRPERTSAPEPLYLRPPDAERWRERNASSTSSS